MDFASLASALLARSESLCREWFPAGKRRGSEYVVGDLNGNPGESLSINLSTGKWADFAADIRGGDLISLYAAREGIDQGEAYKRLTNGHAPACLATPSAPVKQPQIILPVPETASAPSMRHAAHGKPSASWCYRDQQGRTLGYVARYDPQGSRKQIVPWVFSEQGWIAKQFPEPRPLYGLDRLRQGRRVLIVEGEKAADAAQEMAGDNYAVLTWPGGAQALDKANFQPLKGTRVLLWPDADQPGIDAMHKLAARLQPICAEVKVLDVSGQLDGWDAADCTMPWRDFVTWARPRAAEYQPGAPAPVQNVSATAPSNDDEDLIFSSTPMKTAELFREKLPEGGRILHWRGEFYSWDGMRYAIRDRVYMEQRIYKFMAARFTVKEKDGTRQIVPFNPKTNTVNDALHALRAVCYADLPEPQCWIEQQPGDPPAHEIIAFRNGFLHWPTRIMLPATDRLFAISALDFDYNPDALAPTEWIKFLQSVWPDDEESINALAEMFGYLLTDDTSQQKMFMLVGPPRSGKGTILRVLESLVGYPNRVSPSLASLGTQFGLQPLIGKRLAMISDARLSGRADQQPIVENLLRISGEDALSIDRKNIAAWTGKLATRFVLATNELPAFSDASSALANRFMLFRFTQSFLGREDLGLTRRLLAELPSIVLWTLNGLERLVERGYLVAPASTQEMAQDLLEQTSPVTAFVNDRCVLGALYQSDRDDLFDEWKKWCDDQGRDFAGTKSSFGKHLAAAFPSVKRSQPRESGTRRNLYTGIRLRTYEDNFSRGA